jgi:hypothetical protein
MAFQVWIKTDKSLQQLASEIRALFSLPPFKPHALTKEPYYQFEVLGMDIFIREPDEEPRDPDVEEEPRDPEVMNYPYSLNIHTTFTEHELDTDTLEDSVQPYYAHLLAFHLNVKTACSEKKKIGNRWHIRYNIYCKNPRWDGSILYGEPGWEPAVHCDPVGSWRSLS